MANVQSLKVGHSLVQGARGERGGAPSKDSIWGLIKIGSALVKFSGRRGGKLRFKSTPAKDVGAAIAFFEKKLTGGLSHAQRGVAGREAFTYTDVTADYSTEAFTKLVASQWSKACVAGKLDKRSMK